MGSADNRTRRKWQDYGGHNATKAEYSIYEVFEKVFWGTDYQMIPKPNCFNDLYVNVQLPPEEIAQIYNPREPITKHGIQPDFMIRNNRTGKIIFGEIKRQDGWVEGKDRAAGRGNAHERLCKYFTPGLLNHLRSVSGISEEKYPFWIVFQGDITRDPCRVREITFWFDKYKENYFFWRNTADPDPLIEHFNNYIAPMLDE